MRRFITLIDALYEESVQVIVLADEIPTRLLKLTPKERASPFDEVGQTVGVQITSVLETTLGW